jgi:mannose-6-phosphate isomerase
MVLCEIQQHSDITYRVFDYNRICADGKPRALHLQQALNVMRFGEQGGGLCDPVRVTHLGAAETFYAACPYFATERWEFSERIERATSRGQFELLIFLAGDGRLEFADGSETFSPAQVWLLPAALGNYRLAPDSATTVLRTYVPNLNDLAQRFCEEHIPVEQWTRVVHP